MTSSPSRHPRLSRRSLLRASGAGALGLPLGGLLAACGGPGPAGGTGPGDLTATWFGADDRHRRSVEAFRIIEKKVEGLKVKTNFGGFEGYFDRLSTRISSGTAPGLVQMEGGHMPEFAGRDALTDLTPYVEDGKLDISGIEEKELASCRMDGSLYGVSLGTLVPAAVIDTTALGELGLTPPERWTWSQYAEFADSVHEASGGRLAGTEDASSYDNDLEVWLLHRGRAGQVDREGRVVATEDDITEWFEYWARLRASGGAVDPKIQAAHANGNHPNNPLVLGKAVTALQFCTTQAVWSTLTGNTLGFAPMPEADAGGAPGNYTRAGSIWSIPRGTENADTVARVVDLWLNDADVAKALGTCRSVPNANAVKALGGSLDEQQQALVDHVGSVLAGPLADAPTAPKGAARLGDALKSVADSVAYGDLTPRAGAKKYMEELRGVAAA